MQKGKAWIKFAAYMDQITGAAYLAMFLVQAGYRFLMTTEFPVDELAVLEEGTVAHLFISLFLTEPQWILLVIVFLRYAFSREYDWKRYAAALIAGICAFIIYFRNGEASILVYVLLILGAKEIPFRKMIRMYFCLCVSILIVTVAASQLGLVDNHVWDVTYRNIRIAFGFDYPTDFASHILFLCFCWWYLRGKKLTYAEALLTAGLGVFVYVFCEARFSTAMLLLLGGVMGYCRFKEKKNAGYRPHPVCVGLLEAVPVLCAVFIHVISILYDSGNRFLSWLDNLLSQRLALAKRAIDIYGFNLWGSDIPMIGNGSKSAAPEKYFYIDSSYLQFSLLYGVVFLGLVLILFWLAGEKIRKKQEWILMWILALAAVHGLFEQHLLELEFFPFLLLIFADLGGKKRKQKEAEETDGKEK